MFENRVLKKVFGPKREALKGQWIKLNREEVMLCTAHQKFLGRSNQEGDGRVMWHVWRTGELHTGFWCGYLIEGGHLEDLGVDGRIILK